MNYYKDIDGNVFSYESDGSQDGFIGNKKKMTQSEIEAHLNPFPSPPTKNELIARLAVTTQSGKKFDADEVARGRMLSAIQAAEFLGIDESEWKLADNSKQIITLDELKEAHALAIQALGQVVLSN